MREDEVAHDRGRRVTEKLDVTPSNGTRDGGALDARLEARPRRVAPVVALPDHEELAVHHAGMSLLA